MDDGNYSIISIDGINYAVNKRGHNIVVIDSATKEIITRRYDTYKHPYEVFY